MTFLCFLTFFLGEGDVCKAELSVDSCCFTVCPVEVAGPSTGGTGKSNCARRSAKSPGRFVFPGVVGCP